MFEVTWSFVLPNETIEGKARALTYGECAAIVTADERKRSIDYGQLIQAHLSIVKLPEEK